MIIREESTITAIEQATRAPLVAAVVVVVVVVVVVMST
jgi:hypothetical protein